MKKLIFSAIVIIGASVALMSFTSSKTNTANPPQDQAPALFPADVQKIFETSCFDCHSDAGSNAKAKIKLNFSKWGELSNAKKVAKMGSINDEVKGCNMPPAKYSSKHPDKALSQEQKDLINKWVTEESDKLMGQ